MEDDPLKQTILELDAHLPNREWMIGGGYGLFLKQQYLSEHPEIKTLFHPDQLPIARTTEDIDLILRAEVVTDSASMGEIRKAFDALGFVVVETAKYTQFVRKVDRGQVKIDLLAAPLGQYESRVRKDKRRVKPKPSVNLHASRMNEAVAVERDPIALPLSGTLASGETHQTTVHVPQAFSYLLMKLHAFSDRKDDANKDMGRHHALDVYRIVGLMTKDEDELVTCLSAEFQADPYVRSAAEIVARDFKAPEGIGRLRIREHLLHQTSFDLDTLGQELVRIFNGA